MSTTEVTPAPVAESNNESSAHITTNLVTYRSYGAFDENGKAKGVKKTKKKNPDGTEVEEVTFEGLPSILSQTATGDNWKKAEEKGATVLNENAYKFHILTDLAGFDTLVPSKEQQLVIIQKGIDAIETAAANQLQAALEDKASKDDADQYSFNGETIDLLTPFFEGAPSLNTPPKRKNLTDEQKFLRSVGTLSPEKLDSMMAMLEQYKRQLEAQAPTA